MRFSDFLLFAFFFLLTTVIVSALGNKKYEEPLITVMKKIDEPALLTIESPYGDLIDHVIKRKQPAAFDRRILKDHKIQRRLAVQRKKLKRHYKLKKNSTYKDSQNWYENGTRSLQDTIPIRRSTTGDVMRANSVSQFGKKQHPFYQQLEEDDCVYDHAISRFRTPEKLYGAEATINIWQPEVYCHDHSTTQMWMISGDNNSVDAIEVGWHVYPSLYGDHMPRFFISWMSDSYRRSGCYNILCEGFVVTSYENLIGHSSPSVSNYNGRQEETIVHIFKDENFGCWWLHLDGQEMGYWPGNIFTHLREAVYQVDWGGEVFRLMIDDQYKRTQMRSGRFPRLGYRKASFMRNLKVAFSYNNFSLFEYLPTSVTRDICYNIRALHFHPDHGPIFYFGGSAEDPSCST